MSQNNWWGQLNQTCAINQLYQPSQTPKCKLTFANRNHLGQETLHFWPCFVSSEWRDNIYLTWQGNRICPVRESLTRIPTEMLKTKTDLKEYIFGGGIFFRRAHWLVKAQCSINLRRAGQRDKHRWAVTCREIIEWIFIQWCHLFFSGNERMYSYAVTQSYTLTLLDMDFLWNWTHFRFFGIVLCLFEG